MFVERGGGGRRLTVSARRLFPFRSHEAEFLARRYNIAEGIGGALRT